MSIAKDGLTSRRGRLTEEHSGAWASSSQQFVDLATELYKQSADHAKQIDGNCAPYALAGIPMLLSAVRCFLIELYSGVFTGELNPAALSSLAEGSTDIVALRNEGVAPDLLEEFELLVQIRHEILHPAHRPGPEPDGTPRYLGKLKQAGLLQSTGRESDFVWISQLQSHRLFGWAFTTVYGVVDHIIAGHQFHSFAADGLRHSYALHATHDLP